MTSCSTMPAASGSPTRAARSMSAASTARSITAARTGRRSAGRATVSFLQRHRSLAGRRHALLERHLYGPALGLRHRGAGCARGQRRPARPRGKDAARLPTARQGGGGERPGLLATIANGGITISMRTAAASMSRSPMPPSPTSASAGRTGAPPRSPPPPPGASSGCAGPAPACSSPSRADQAPSRRLSPSPMLAPSPSTGGFAPPVALVLTSRLEKPSLPSKKARPIDSTAV
jgi:hypothetical protein